MYPDNMVSYMEKIPRKFILKDAVNLILTMKNQATIWGIKVCAFLREKKNKQIQPEFRLVKYNEIHGEKKFKNDND